MLPISAYWTRCSGLASVLAPTSRRKQFFPLAVGMMEPIAGRSMPAMRCRPKSAAAITAPLFPALTKALARPSEAGEAGRAEEPRGHPPPAFSSADEGAAPPVLHHRAGPDNRRVLLRS